MGAAENEYHEKMQRLALQRDRAPASDPTASDLAADVRAALDRYVNHDRSASFHVALDALVARVDTLTRERDALAEQGRIARAEAAEAALADTRRALEEIAYTAPANNAQGNLNKFREIAARALAAGDTEAG